jgi:HAD superfamily hydrolase (TIGR01509 family)
MPADLLDLSEGGLAAVLVDMDGLLVDSEPLWTVAEEELALELGGAWSTELKAAVMGTRLDVAVPTILEWYGVAPTPDAVAEASQFLLDRMVGLYSSAVPLRPGALDLLEALHVAKIPTALVSSSFRVLVDAVLATLGADRFATSVAGDEVEHGKPHPEPYLTACSRLAVAPRRCVVLEDSEAGLRSGEAAGCVVVGVPDTAPLAIAPGRTVIASLAELDIPLLSRLVRDAVT